MAKPTVVLLPVWASGHFMPTLEAGKRLVAALGSGVSLTVLVMRPPTRESASQVAAHVARESATEPGVGGGCEVIFHRLPSVDPPTDCVTVEEFTSRYIHLHAPHVRAAVAALPAPAAALVVEFTSTTMLDVARELGVPAYVYFASSAAMLALMLRLPALHEEVTADFGEMEGQHVHVSGLPPVPASCMPQSVMSKKSPSYADTVYHGGRLTEAEGIIVNTATELEPAVLAAIAKSQCTPERPAPPLYPIGPVIPSDGASSNYDCLQWLDVQSHTSVVFLCFGSLGFLSAEQVREAATGLERSGQRFLWALRASPTVEFRHSSDASILDDLLPDGFLERTKERGLVWPAWAPQREILAHPAVGGFVTHCGWNSVLEALWAGVPMAPWPLYAEQHLNAFELVAAMGVAVRMDVDRKRNNLVEAGELARAVRCLVSGTAEEEEGKRARERAAVARDACRKAVARGGSSYASLHGVAAALRRRLEA
ncbi:anthocyanidin 3-O-glucosyltransferase 2-like [Phragmites australis]|uniref:anthocyanidin 3-O-glucosyltransferase 2-like n=1 Tax=Phragmites australis TaxID=29695 RepID=UPI002D7A29C5|nr:anthocyanidin 3-O-glucosyltransferase 2-like [Phragmites australis]